MKSDPQSALHPTSSLRIAIEGSGFAGSILARALHLQRHRVTRLDSQRHPRFALGESSTSLAALSLERFARLPGLGDLAPLAAHGCWQRTIPHLRCGLKRGFTFYRHHPGEPYRNGPGNDARLLVAASPDDEGEDVCAPFLKAQPWWSRLAFWR